VPGGGAALVHVISALDGDLGLSGDEATGVGVVRSALVEPLRWIAANAGHDGYVTVAAVRELPWGSGLDAATGQYGDLLAAGIIDPVKVTRKRGHQRGVHRRLLLTTETLVSRRRSRRSRRPTATATVTATSTARLLSSQLPRSHAKREAPREGRLPFCL